MGQCTGGEIILSTCLAVLIQQRSVTDEQTDRQNSYNSIAHHPLHSVACGRTIKAQVLPL